MFNKKLIEQFNQDMLLIKSSIKNIEEQTLNFEKNEKKINQDINNIYSENSNLLSELSKLQFNFNILSQEMNEIKDLLKKISDTQLNNLELKFKYYNPELNLLNHSNKYKILIVGFYGATNLGDELMLETLLHYFNNFNFLYSITIMIANNPEYDIFKFNNINFIHYPQTKFDYNYLSEYYDAVIFGGGAIIDDQNYNVDNSNEISLSTTLIELSHSMIIKNKKVYWIGLSTNTKLKNKTFVSKLNFIIKNITYISLRDTNSLISIKKSGIEINNIEIINDIVLANPLLKQIKSKKSQQILNIGVILICFNELTENCNNLLIEELFNYTKNMNININFIPFYDFQHNDKIYLTNILKDKRYIGNVLNYPESYEKCLEILNNQDYIISMRYHGSLLAMALNKPLLTIIWDKHPHYNNKMQYIYEQYSSDFNILKVSEITKEKINIALKKLMDSKKTNKKMQKDIFEISENKILNLIEFINEEKNK